MTRPPTPRLPEDAAAPLRAALRVERVARGEQKATARAATGRLIAACLGAGWTQGAVAAATGLSIRAVSERARRARATGPQPTGLVVPRPPEPARRRRPRPAADEVDWLRPGQAALVMGVHINQLWEWRRHGLLPNTRTTSAGHARYARADLLAVLRLRGGRKILPRGTAARYGNPEAGQGQVVAVPRKLVEGRRAARLHPVDNAARLRPA